MSSTRTVDRRRHVVGALGLGLALTLVATACGADDGSDAASTSATGHDPADVAFATDMIQHHAQALSMVDLTVDRTLDPGVQAVAEAVREAQGPEIETMTDWLTDWGEEIPETMRDHSHAGHDGGDLSDSMEGLDDSMPGMMSADDLVALEEASDAEFGDLWLQMMIEHHAGAIEMAETQLEEGRYQPALELAEDIVTAQEAEIETMESLLRP